jgi:hypothetical protein
MDDLKHLNASVLFCSKVHVTIHNGSLTDVEQSFSWPVCEPINRTTVDEGWELSETSLEEVSKWRHGNNQVNV